MVVSKGEGAVERENKFSSTPKQMHAKAARRKPRWNSYSFIFHSWQQSCWSRNKMKLFCWIFAWVGGRLDSGIPSQLCTSSNCKLCEMRIEPRQVFRNILQIFLQKHLTKSFEAAKKRQALNWNESLLMDELLRKFSWKSGVSLSTVCWMLAANSRGIKEFANKCDCECLFCCSSLHPRYRSQVLLLFSCISDDVIERNWKIKAENVFTVEAEKFNLKLKTARIYQINVFFNCKQRKERRRREKVFLWVKSCHIVESKLNNWAKCFGLLLMLLFMKHVDVDVEIVQRKEKFYVRQTGAHKLLIAICRDFGWFQAL